MADPHEPDLEAAAERLEAVLDELHAEGFQIWGWDSGEIFIATTDPIVERPIQPRQ